MAIIEDIQYLKKNSMEESYIFVVDSEHRDKNKYRTPENYTIHFSTPFNLVYGIDVLDASIPRSSYCVNEESTKLRIAFFNDPNNQIPSFLSTYNTNLNSKDEKDALLMISNFEEITIEEGDYDVTALVNELNKKFATIPSYNNLNLKVRNLLVKGKFQFYCDMSFIIDGYNSTINEVIGFNMPLSANEVASNYVTDIKYESLNKLYYSGAVQETFDTSNPYRKFEKLKIKDVETKTDTVAFKLMNKAIIEDINIGIAPKSYERNAMYTIKKDNEIIEDGILKIDAKSNTTEKMKSTTRKEIDKNGELNMKISMMKNKETDKLEDFELMPKFVPTFNGTLTKHSIIPPGMYNLTGERYIILKCDEIQQHLHKSKAFEKYNSGLTKFKMGVVGYDDQRFDYTTTISPALTFHPIGKLSQMSLRFEKGDGSLYNFRGLNHTVTFLIKYYKPIFKLENFDNYTLNPNYNPDMIEYKFQEQESESDEEN
tara:strand:+ start:2807 stop:4261 length:1455 start_codon:yes stop_codon:yes gene_type:complete